MRSGIERVICLLCLLCGALSVSAAVAQEANPLAELSKLGLGRLQGPMLTYYSDGKRERAEKTRTDIEAMNAFFQERLGIRADVALAVVDSGSWAKVNSKPYGLPNINQRVTPPVIYMPATSGGMAFQLMMARKEAIPAEELEAYVRASGKEFEAVADDFVDLIAFHELGHALVRQFGIGPRCHWLNEFLASYFSYAFVSGQSPAKKRVFDLLGRPSKVRPKNTTLEDLERIYNRVDDYGWYQGMFEERIHEIYPRLGLEFVKDARREFPQVAKPEPLPPAEVLGRLERIAPGFEAWGERFR